MNNYCYCYAERWTKEQCHVFCISRTEYKYKCILCIVLSCHSYMGSAQNISKQVVIEKIPRISIHVMSYNVSKYHLNVKKTSTTDSGHSLCMIRKETRIMTLRSKPRVWHAFYLICIKSQTAWTFLLTWHAFTQKRSRFLYCGKVANI